jgi:hypothetical protein
MTSEGTVSSTTADVQRPMSAAGADKWCNTKRIVNIVEAIVVAVVAGVILALILR